MMTVIGLFADEGGAARAAELMGRIGIDRTSVDVVAGEGARSVAIGDAPSGVRVGAGLARGGALAVANVPDEQAASAEAAMRQAGAREIAAREGVGQDRTWPEADAAGWTFWRDEHGESTERNDWNARETLAYGTEMGAGAAAGGTMGAPIGPGTAAAAGGLMGATPGDTPADDAPIDLPNPERQADIERQRRASDPAP